jgi:hypothetical protein
MTVTCTILGPYAPTDFNDSNAKATIQSAIVSALGSNTPVAVDPHTILGNVYIFITTHD